MILLSELIHFARRFPCASLLLATFCFISPARADISLGTPPGIEKSETTADGTAHYYVDGQGRKDGPYEEFYRSNKIHFRGTFAAGARNGLWTTYDEAGKILESCTYVKGEMHGVYTWNDPASKAGFTTLKRNGGFFGALTIRDESGKVAREGKYPHDLDDIRSKWASLYPLHRVALHFTKEPAITPSYTAGALADDSLQEALKYVKLYRYLSGVPYEGLTLDPIGNIKAQHGAVLLQKLHMLTHTPPKPADMDDAFFKLAYAGCHEGCEYGPGIQDNALLESIDRYMDDSDPSNVNAIGHRCWTLFPGLKKVGFGVAAGFATMHVVDPASSASSRFPNFIAFPGEGYYPASLIKSHYAWSAHFPLAHYKIEGLKITVTKLDDRFQPDEDIPADIVSMPSDEYQGWTVVIFRPKFPGLKDDESIPMGRYWVGFQGLKTTRGVDTPFGYLVDFIDPSTPESSTQPVTNRL